MIELNEFEFPAKDFLQMYRWEYIVSSCWSFCYTTVFLFSLATATDIWIPSLIGIVIMPLILIVYYYVVFLYYTFSKSCRSLMFQKRKLAFDEQKYYASAEDGSEGSGPLSHFIYANVWNNNYYRLYMNRFMYVPVPKSAFRSEEDRLRFETEIFAPRLKKKSYWKRYVIFLIVSAILLGTGFAIRATTIFDEYDYIETNYIEEQSYPVNPVNPVE